MESLWRETARRPRFASLKKDVSTDVLVIGGGLTGLLCAHCLGEAGVDYLLIEAKSICSGVVGGTTAKLTVQHGLIFDKLVREFGPEKARLYYEANREALEAYRVLCREIDCGYEEQSAFVYSLADSQRLERELEAMERIGVPGRLVRELPLPFPVAGAIEMLGQAQFHPLQFLYGLARGLRICEHTKALELGPDEVVTDRGRVRYQKLIVATHFPLLNKHGGYFLKLYQSRSYVLALENAPALEGMYVDEAEGGLSFRSWNGLLLLGGGGHRTGKRGEGWTPLEAFAKKYYPQAVVAARWSSQDCMSLDGVPYIGQYGRNTPNLYVATGYNKWGFTSAMVAARLLTGRILGRENPWAQVFTPQRTSLRRQLAVNGLEAVVSLLMPTVPRCPHMGCALKYNAPEHSWDCPCHGSRFTEGGELIDNPATDDLSIRP